MKKLTPTSVILMIAGLGAILVLLFYYKEKRSKQVVADAPPVTGTAPATTTTTTTPQGLRPVFNRGIKPPVRLIKTPVGFMTR